MPFLTRRGRIVLVAAATGICFAAAQGAAGVDGAVAAELLDRAYKNVYGGDLIQVLRVTSRSQTGHRMTRRLQIARKRSGEPSKAMVRFLSPPDIRGTSMLVIEHALRCDEIFVFAPALGRIRRVSGAQRFDSFFATDFTYEDLEPKSLVDYDVAHLGRDNVGDVSCVRIEARPRAGLESQYNRTVSCVDPLRAVVLRTDYYVGDELWKVLEADPASVREIDGYHVPMEARLHTPTRGTETWILTERYELQADLPDSLFTAQSLQKGDPRGDWIRATPQEPDSGGKGQLRDRGE